MDLVLLLPWMAAQMSVPGFAVAAQTGHKGADSGRGHTAHVRMCILSCALYLADAFDCRAIAYADGLHCFWVDIQHWYVILNSLWCADFSQQ